MLLVLRRTLTPPPDLCLDVDSKRRLSASKENRPIVGPPLPVSDSLVGAFLLGCSMCEFSVRNWDKFQHYKDRSPPWIKLHRSTLMDYQVTRLPDEAKAHLFLIWLLAADMDNRIPLDPQWVGLRISASSTVDLAGMLRAQLIEAIQCPEQCDSKLLASCPTARTGKEKHATDHARERRGEREAEAEAEEREIIVGTPDGEPDDTQPDSSLMDGREVIRRVNEALGLGWKKASKKLLARLRSGDGTVDECVWVVELHHALWANDPGMERYVRQETLFAPEKFEDYRAQAVAWSKSPAGPTSWNSPRRDNGGDRCTYTYPDESKGTHDTGIWKAFLKCGMTTGHDGQCGPGG